MADILTPNGIRLEMIYTQGSQRIQNVYHATKGSPATIGDLQALWTIAKDWENLRAKLSRSNTCTLVLIVVTALDSLASPQWEAAPNPLITGSNAGVAMPLVCSIAVKHATSGIGRSKRGRTYHIGLPNTFVTDAEMITLAAAIQIAGDYNDLRARMLAGGFTFVVNSMYSGVQIVNGRRRAIPRAAGVMQAITGSTCERGIDTQRHRKPAHQV